MSVHSFARFTKACAWVLSVLGMFCCFLDFASAQVVTGPIASATGNAGRAAVDPGESSLLNPASLAHLQRYYVNGHFGIGEHRHEGKFQQYGALLADGTPTNIVAGSFAYHRRKVEQPGGFEYALQDFQIALAGFAIPNVAIGVAGHRLIYEPERGADRTQDNAILGLLYTPVPYLGVGLTAHDVLPASDDVPAFVRNVPTFAVGTHFVFKEVFRFRFDLIRPEKRQLNLGMDLITNQRINVAAGVETFFQERWAFRLGGHWRETVNQMYVTAGLGFKGPRLSFDYSFQKDVRADHAYRHLFDLWLPF